MTCLPSVHVGSFTKSSQSYDSFFHQLQPFIRSWKIGSPEWYWHAMSLFSSSLKYLVLHPLLAHAYLPSFMTGTFSTSGAFWSSCFLFLLLLSIKISCCLNPDLVLLNSVFCILDCRRLPKSRILLYIGMLSSTAAFDFLEFVPIINYLITSGPAFFDIVENWFAIMKLAAWMSVLTFLILLIASCSFTF